MAYGLMDRTRGSGPLGLGSIPSTPAKKEVMFKLLVFLILVIVGSLLLYKYSWEAVSN